MVRWRRLRSLPLGVDRSDALADAKARYICVIDFMMHGEVVWVPLHRACTTGEMAAQR